MFHTKSLMDIVLKVKRSIFLKNYFRFVCVYNLPEECWQELKKIMISIASSIFPSKIEIYCLQKKSWVISNAPLAILMLWIILFNFV